MLSAVMLSAVMLSVEAPFQSLELTHQIKYCRAYSLLDQGGAKAFYDRNLQIIIIS
jgi:hypothetical protein